MSAVPNWIPVSVETYLEQEVKALYKNEYVDGVMVAMAGTSFDHAQIASNFNLYLRLVADPRGCRVYVSDCLVRANQSRYYYPDVVVVCGRLRDDRRSGTQVLLNPNIVVEVLSPSTENRDRREKRLTYMQHPTITDVLLVAQDAVYIKHSARDDQGEWHTQTYTSLTDSIELPLLGANLSLNQIYQFVFSDGEQ